MASGQGTRRMPTEQRRQHILDEALTLYSRDGYDAVGMRDIAAACGMTATSIYRHFDNKEALLVGIFDRLSDEMTSGMREASRIDELPERLLHLIRTHISLAMGEPPIIRVYQREELSLPPQERQRFRKVERSYVGLWVETVCALRPETTQQEARTAVIAAFGAINSIAGTHSTRSARSVVTQLVEITLRVLNVQVDI